MLDGEDSKNICMWSSFLEREGNAGRRKQQEYMQPVVFFRHREWKTRQKNL